MKSKDKFTGYDERTLPESLRQGERLLFVRGGTSKYALLKPFHAVTLAEWSNEKNSQLEKETPQTAKEVDPRRFQPTKNTVLRTRKHTSSDVDTVVIEEKKNFVPPEPLQTQGKEETINVEKVRVLQALLDRLEDMDKTNKSNAPFGEKK